MGQNFGFEKVNLFSGIIFRDKADLYSLELLLSEKFSSIDLSSEIFDFDFTDYYFKEMGSPLFRRFISFSELISPTDLPSIKNFTNEVENIYSSGGKRRVNIDPGYLSNANVIIATTKNHYHRVPLSEGIYSHMEYVFKNRSLKFLEWTYPDFRTDEYVDFFKKLSSHYKKKIKNSNK